MNYPKFCPNHPDIPCKCKGLCRRCYEKQLRESNPAYKKRQQENSKKWHRKNKKHKSQYDKKRIAKRHKNPKLREKDREKKYLSTILRLYNVTKEQYEELVKLCNNKCMICTRPPHPGKRLHLDHNHKTGKVRGLLCTRCNWYLHTIEKNPDILNHIKKYLKNGRK